MSDPATLAVVIAATSKIVEGFSAYQQDKYKAQIATMNQQVAEQNASRAIDRSQVEQQTQDNAARAALGEQTENQATSGLALTGRSFVQARRNARTLARLDALNIRQAGSVEAYNYKVDAVNYGAEATAAKSEGVGALLGGFLGAGSSLASGSSKTANPGKYTAGEAYTARLPRPRPKGLLS